MLALACLASAGAPSGLRAVPVAGVAASKRDARVERPCLLRCWRVRAGRKRACCGEREYDVQDHECDRCLAHDLLACHNEKNRVRAAESFLSAASASVVALRARRVSRASRFAYARARADTASFPRNPACAASATNSSTHSSKVAIVIRLWQCSYRESTMPRVAIG